MTSKPGRCGFHPFDEHGDSRRHKVMVFDEFRDTVSRAFVPLDADSDDRAHFHGVIRGAALGSMNINEVTASAHVIRRTSHAIHSDDAEFFKVGLQMEGYSVLEQDGREALMTPGDFAIYDTTRPYRLSFDDTFRMLVIMLPREVLHVSPASIAQLTAQRFSGRRGVSALTAQYLRGIGSLNEDPPPVVAAHLHSGVLDLLSAVLNERLGSITASEVGRFHADRLRITAFIEAHLADPALDSSAVAAAHHISVRQLQKIFESDGTSVAASIRTRRLERCRGDLANPLLAHVPVASIGARWGLLDPAHFSRVFKAAHGMAPGAYRSELGKERTEWSLMFADSQQAFRNGQ